MTNKRFTLFFSAILMIATVAAIVSASDWQQSQTDEANDGIAADSAPVAAPDDMTIGDVQPALQGAADFDEGNDAGYLFGLSNWTRYDFDTARATESPKKAWAFKYQVDDNSGGGDPSEEFNATEYANIRFDDNVYASNQTTTNGYYAAHRFNFSIDDNEESWITKINVTWKGKGDHDGVGATKGAKLYIYNFTSAAYEQLDSDTAGPPTEITLTNEKTSSISSYISSSNNVTVLVNQTSAQTSGLGGAEYSYIETDYVKLVVTP